MLRALLPLVVLILVMVWLYTPSHTDPVTEIDPGPAVGYAASIAGFDVLAAQDLPADWRPTSARVDPEESGGPVGLTVGYVTPAGEFAQVVQSSVPRAQLLDEVLGSGYTSSGAGGSGRWQEYQTADGEAALVLALSASDASAASDASDASTVVVTGSAGTGELRVLVDALRPVSG